MKYIDAEKLIAEIKKRIKFHDDAMKACTGINTIVITHSAGWKEDTKLLDIIDSLQQEQDCIVINKKDWKAQEQFRKNKDFGKPLKEEQPKKSKKDCNGCPHCVDRKDQFGWHFKGCFGGPYNGKFIAEIDECPLQQEQPEVDLENKFGWHNVSEETPKFGDYVIVACKNKNKEDGIWLYDFICWEGKWEPRENWETPLKWISVDELGLNARKE